MKEYIGTKIVKAAPALRLTDEKGNVRVELLSSNPIPVPGDAVDMGYKVVYPDGYERAGLLRMFLNIPTGPPMA